VRQKASQAQKELNVVNNKMKQVENDARMSRAKQVTPP
jgi:uncharacterized coiled-coil protein SlyX